MLDVAAMNIYTVILYMKWQKSEEGRKSRRVSEGTSRLHSRALICRMKIRGGCMKIRYLNSLSLKSREISSLTKCIPTTFLTFVPRASRPPFSVPFVARRKFLRITTKVSWRTAKWNFFHASWINGRGMCVNLAVWISLRSGSNIINW